MCALIGALVFAFVLSGCARDRGQLTPRPEISDAEVLAAHNERVARLGTIWSRGQIRFGIPDGDGGIDVETGDLNLRIQQPSNVALIVKKLGETYVWLGADGERYWLIDLLSDETVAVVGRHELLTAAKIDALRLPVPPHELVRLLGIASLPVDADIDWSPGAGAFVIEHDADVITDDPGDTPRWRTMITPRRMLPVEVALVSGDGRPILVSTLSAEKRVETTGPVDQSQPEDPFTPANIEISRVGTDEFVLLELQGISDRPSRPAVYDLRSRLDALQPSGLVDIDAPPLPPSDDRGAR